MCTAMAYQTKDHYFGRNLDLDCSYGETVTVTPRHYLFAFRQAPAMPRHYAIIGMAHLAGGYPLYYDATNEAGLSMAGLNFPGNAVYRPAARGKDNVTPFELIPWILGQCASLGEAQRLLDRLNLLDLAFRPDMPLAPLHWMLSDKTGCLVVEPLAGGLAVADNPAQVLTNNPPFAYQRTNLSNYLNLTPREPENRFAQGIRLETYCKGMGAMGLPGDMSSVSRFVRGAFVRLNAVSGAGEEESVAQFFHLLGAVSQPRGCVRLDNGGYELTVYSSCCNATRGIYYYTTYENSRLSAVDMHRVDLEGNRPVSYPLTRGLQVDWQN